MLLKKYIICTYKFLKNRKNKKHYQETMKKRIETHRDAITPLTDSEKTMIKKYWSKFGYNPDLNAFKWFYNVSGQHDCRFITEDFYACNIMPRAYSSIKATAMDDKNLYDLYFKDVQMPETIIRNVNGLFLDKEYNIISREKAVEIVCSVGEKIVIKQSTNSCRGEGVKLIEPIEIESAMEEYTCNYIVQKKINQHHAFALLNDSSSNVVRITSVLANEKVYLFSPTIRIGDVGRFTDQGGEREFCIGIDNEGRLKEYGLATKCSIVPEKKLPNGFLFGGMECPGFKKMQAIATQLHPRLASFPIISWDFMTNDKGIVFLIECNLHWSGIMKYQECNGPLFGEQTDEILNALLR